MTEAPASGASAAPEAPATATATAPPAAERDPIPGAARWGVIFAAPAVGTVLGMGLAFQLLWRWSPLTFAVLVTAGGALGCGLALAVGLLLVPLSAPAAGPAPESQDDAVPPAPHPARPWLAALLLAVAALVGVPLAGALSGARLGDAWMLGGPLALAALASRWPAGATPARGGLLLAGLTLGFALDPYLPGAATAADAWPAGPALLLAAGAVGLLALDRGRGASPTTAHHAPLHRLVLRALLRAFVVACPVGLGAGGVALAFERQEALRDAGRVALGAALVAAALTLSEALARRGRPWLVHLAVGLLVPLLAGTTGLLAIHMGQTSEPLLALAATLDDLAAIFVDPWESSKVLALGGACVPPFVLLSAARAGTLPYLGWRGPWPLVAQLPLAALAGVVLVALVAQPWWRAPRFHLAFVVAGLVTLVLALAVCPPLERRLASRWRRLVAGE